MIGSGYGGAVICLVTYHEVVPFAEALVSEYQKETDRSLQPIVLPMADGVSG
jgi:galactokinase